MLSDREKLILHFCCTVTIARLTGVNKPDKLIEKMIEDIRRNDFWKTHVPTSDGRYSMEHDWRTTKQEH